VVPATPDVRFGSRFPRIFSDLPGHISGFGRTIKRSTVNNSSRPKTSDSLAAKAEIYPPLDRDLHQEKIVEGSGRDVNRGADAQHVERDPIELSFCESGCAPPLFNRVFYATDWLLSNAPIAGGPANEHQTDLAGGLAHPIVCGSKCQSLL
jgi:hypothetical protein